MPKVTKKAVQDESLATMQTIEGWFLRHFGHITPGTPDHAVALAAKNDLLASLKGPERPTAIDVSES